jgi:hypothetical protein
MFMNAHYCRPTTEELMADDDAHENAHPLPGGVIDPVRLGRLIRSARVLAGFDGAVPFGAEVERHTGVPMTKPIVYAIETGERDVTVREVFAILYVLRHPRGLDYLLDAADPDVAETLRRH